MFDFLKAKPVKDKSKSNITRGWPELPLPVEKHEWHIVNRSYAAPVRDFSDIDLMKLPLTIIQKITLGVTTYILECALTGDRKTEEILGSDRDTLDDVLSKVNQYGKRIIRDSNDRSYSIDRHFEQTDIASLPVRKQ